MSWWQILVLVVVGVPVVSILWAFALGYCMKHQHDYRKTPGVEESRNGR